MTRRRIRRIRSSRTIASTRCGNASQQSLPSVTVEIGGIPILLQPSDPEFCDVLESRYETFATRNAAATPLRTQTPSAASKSISTLAAAPPTKTRASRATARIWNFRRGDFDATWNPRTGHGRITQCPNPYSIDTVLRITHSLVLAEQGGFLLHAASAIRNNRAFLFAGVSGAGKTTMSRLAPSDATVLTDEISYVRRSVKKRQKLRRLRHALRRRTRPRRRQHFRAARSPLSPRPGPRKSHRADLQNRRRPRASCATSSSSPKKKISSPKFSIPFSNLSRASTSPSSSSRPTRAPGSSSDDNDSHAVANTYVSRSHAVAARELAGEMMIMSATDSTLFSLNETATLIWNAADGKTSLRDIVENKICAEFDIEPEAAYRDAEALVTNLAELGILQSLVGTVVGTQLIAMSLITDLNRKALERGVPLTVHLDVTYRCNERCEHCYLEHDGDGEMSTAEIISTLDQLAAAGVFFLTISGGEPLIRRDIFEIIEYARSLRFNVKLKTNAILIREKEARRLRELNVEQVQISVYSHRAQVHDGISKVPGSLDRTIRGIRLLKAHGLKVTIANVLMKGNLDDAEGVRQLAAGSRRALHARSHDHADDERRRLASAPAHHVRQPAHRLHRFNSGRKCRRILRPADTRSTKTRSKVTRAAPATPPPTSRRGATSTPACSSR